MKRFVLIANSKKDPRLVVTNDLASFLREKDCDCIVSTLQDMKQIPADTDCVVVLGGDGTLLEVARHVVHDAIPLLGVNLGTVGYLTEVEHTHVREAADRLLSGDYQIENRMMLQGSITAPEGNMLSEGIALNDIVIARYGSIHLIRLHVYVNGLHLNSYNADGVILSTPTGSTGYNMSAGGPIVEPTAQLILLTPVAPHTLNTRSIILSADDQVRIVIDEMHDDIENGAHISFDATDGVHVTSGCSIDIRRASRETRIIRLDPVGFLDTLHQKMT